MYHRTCLRAWEHILCTITFRAFRFMNHFPVPTNSCTFLRPCSAVHSCAHVQLYIPVLMFSCTFLYPCSAVHSCAHVQLYIPVPMFSCTFLCPCSAVHSCAYVQLYIPVPMLSCTFLCPCSAVHSCAWICLSACARFRYVFDCTPLLSPPLTSLRALIPFQPKRIEDGSSKSRLCTYNFKGRLVYIGSLLTLAQLDYTTWLVAEIKPSG